MWLTTHSALMVALNKTFDMVIRAHGTTHAEGSAATIQKPSSRH